MLLSIKMRHTLFRILFLAFIGLASTSIGSGQEPNVVQAVAPIYPLIALSARAMGAVIVEVQIDSKGAATSVRVIEGAATLRPISEFTARRWLFAPSGTAVRRVQLTFRFTIVPDQTTSAERSPIFRPPYEIEIRDVVPHFKQRVDSDPPMKRKRK
jgi:Gram-negative bacterial TonB protein C-terminal